MRGLRIFLVPMVIFPSPNAQAARLFSSGFENQSVAAGVEWDTTTGSPAIDTTTKRTGAASMRCNPSGATAYMTKATATMAAGDVWKYRFYLRIASSPSAVCQIFRAFSSTNGFAIRLDTDNTLQLWDINGGAQRGSNSAALSADTWYRIEVSANWDTNATTAYVDGSSFATSTTFNIASVTYSLGVGVDGTTNTADLYFDDFAYNNQAGSVDNGLPGAGGIVHLRPNGAGDTTTNTGIGGSAPASTVWESMDETTPDDGVTYSTMPATSSLFDVALQDSATAGIGAEDTVNLVQVGWRGEPFTNASCNWIPNIKSQASGVLLTGSTTAVTGTAYVTMDDTNPKNYKLTASTEPQAGAAWTSSLLDTTQIRITNSDATPDMLTTALWLLVDFVDNEAASGSAEPFVPRRIIVTE